MADTDSKQDILKDRRVIIGITGGVAAYKMAGLVSHLRQRGAEVRVVMTEAATWFVTPTTFATLSGREVVTKMFGVPLADEMHHIHLQDFGEVFLIAPATADVLAKAAHGIADDLLSTCIVAAKCPVIFAPAMNEAMWCNPIVQANVAALREHGYRIVAPEVGHLACGVTGTGRLADEAHLLAALEDALLADEMGPDLSAHKLVVSAGPTREALDPVRYLSNPSSGKMGFAVARAAERLGAEVTLVAGPTELASPPGVTVVPVVTCAEMKDAVLEAVKGASAFVSAAAPADYTPAEVSPVKLKKGADMLLRLIRTDDILLAVGAAARPAVMVGFAAETGDPEAVGREKLAAKNLDLLVANDVTGAGSGFAVDTNRVVILRRDGGARRLPLMSKLAIAQVILAEVGGLLSQCKER